MMNSWVKASSILSALSMIIINSLSIMPMMMIHLWCLMEVINIIMIFIILVNSKHKNFTKFFFLVQSLSSLTMMMFIIMLQMNMSGYISNSVFYLSIMIKMGLFPFHQWVIFIFENLSLMLCFMMMTLPKIIPLIMSTNLELTMPMHMSMIITPIMISLKVLANYSIKFILASSSIIHSCWMILCTQMSTSIWLIYFVLYVYTSLSLCLYINFMYSTHNKFPHMLNKQLNKEEKVMIFSLIFMMISIPPMSTFFTKVYPVIISMNNNLCVPIISLLLSSILFLLFYTRFFISALMMSYDKNKNLNYNKILSHMMIMTVPLMTASLTLPILFK